jgi:hypothetical protein
MRAGRPPDAELERRHHRIVTIARFGLIAPPTACSSRSIVEFSRRCALRRRSAA